MKTKWRKIDYTFSAEFASEVMEEIPTGYIDKSICGCGFTSMGLENKKNTIIAVPTIELARNKAEQYPMERCSNNVLAVWGDTSREEIEEYLVNNDVTKILVTYDSINKVADLLPTSHLVIDESNQLLSNTKLKPAVINNVFNIAEQYKDTVSFISATPTPLVYMPEWISTIDQVKIHWTNTMKSTPMRCERTYPYKSLRMEFIAPLYEKKSLTIEGKTFTKVIVFLNNIKQISEIVRETGIPKEDCSIICGDNLRNDLKIIGIKRYKYGIMPMFTFVTSMGFQGIDLSDDSAMTIVVSNTGKNWLMIDMLTDLKQAVSRQRNKKNPNYGCFIYIYNQSLFSKTEEELLTIVDSVRRKIELNIPHFDSLKAKGDEKYFITDSDFNAYTIFKDGKYVLNEQAFNADKYFILEIRKQYQKGFDVAGLLGESIELEHITLPKDVTYKTLVDHFKRSNYKSNWGMFSSKTEWIRVIEASYKRYSKVWDNYTNAKRMVDCYGNKIELVKIEIETMFRVGCTYTRKQIKTELQKIYTKYNIPRSAKHTDLKEYFTTRDIKTIGDRKVVIVS